MIQESHSESLFTVCSVGFLQVVLIQNKWLFWIWINCSAKLHDFKLQYHLNKCNSTNSFTTLATLLSFTDSQWPLCTQILTHIDPDAQFVLRVCFSVISSVFCQRDSGMSQRRRRGEGRRERGISGLGWSKMTDLLWCLYWPEVYSSLFTLMCLCLYHR